MRLVPSSARLLVAAALVVCLLPAGFAQEEPAVVEDGLGNCFKAANNFPMMFCDRVVCNGAGSKRRTHAMQSLAGSSHGAPSAVQRGQDVQPQVTSVH